MNIRIVCIGKLKERYWREAQEEYAKRLSGYCSLQIQELPEARQEDDSRAGELRVIEAEGERILKAIKDSEYVITLEIKGQKLSSVALADSINSLALAGKSDLAFVIGGSLGLSPAVSQRADFKLSFSDMTFPHQMMRVVLLEQIYRSFKIIRKETYHK